LAGPYDDDSGKRRGERQIKGDAARRAISSTWLVSGRDAAQSRAQGLLSAPDRQREREEVALVACMRKLIVILNIMIARRQKWNPDLYAWD